jgi:uncharacterized protein (DUF1697 family)
MEYDMTLVALLRGINVGQSVRVSMADLSELFSAQGCTQVKTYINSGNVVFHSELEPDILQGLLEQALLSRYGQEIRTLVLRSSQILYIAKAIPDHWQNDQSYKSDVAYLFPSIDSDAILDALPVKRKYLELIYTPGALLWRIDRKLYGKSQINKLVAHPTYQEMTVRNVNTARKLAELVGDENGE